MRDMHKDLNKYKQQYRNQLDRSVDIMKHYRTNEQKYKDELSRLHQEVQSARTRPTMVEGGIQADETDIRREYEYQSAPFTSRYNADKFNAGDKGRPSPFREQMRGKEPPEKYTFVPM